ncbi:NAD-dependent epimerase/dehydratase family protein [Bradyrhizobium xenonodulans]|uniref:NAD-dependent epimerase/dehydratase family protein n=1 Tax=Bradyrhizobium xenonodulans TaxID=2736875 RepID=A0ABY7MQY4_9BRAD|nr:NAD-dependent epimerase/dehydratase family protein [Bradyrhizobium xenonodulans]WBL80341.1 NAD-dependent epimerase/dehydratase family protein [Bradyrhizobium xenonodulans]
MKRKILIVGGAGFVGRQLVRKLQDRHDICVIDTLKFGNRFGEGGSSRIVLEKVDIRDWRAVSNVMERFRPEILIHLAAIHFIPECERDPAQAEEVNVLGTMNLLRACPVGTRFVFASSGAVYRPGDGPHDESSSVEPADVYGLTKLHAENYVRYFVKQRGLCGAVVRLFNVVGPGETSPHILPEIIYQLKSGSTKIKLGNIWPQRDYIHVEDAAEGFGRVALYGEVPTGVTKLINLGTGTQYSVSMILDQLRSLTGLPIEVEHDASRARTVDRPFLQASIARIKADFGWSPRLDLAAALADLWKNPDLAPSLVNQLRNG